MHKSLFKNIILILFLLAGLISVATPFLHNHTPDLLEHHDCPALIVETIFAAAIIAAGFALVLIIRLQKSTAQHRLLPGRRFLARRPTRAPPAFSF